MKMKKPIWLRGIFSLILIFQIPQISCNKSKEVAEEEEAKVPIIDDKKVNVDVDINQQPPTVSTEKNTETTVRIDSNMSEAALKTDLANLNSNLQKLQLQIKNSNDLAKVEINKQIQQLNVAKENLQKKIAELEVKNLLFAEQQKMELARKQYIDLTEKKLVQMQKKLDNLNNQVNYVEESVKFNVENQIAKLEDKKNNIELKLNDLQIQNINNLKSLQNQINNMISEFEKNYNNLVSSQLSSR